MKKNIIKPLIKKQINKALKKRNLENTQLITTVEKIFKEKRGYSIKIPPQKTPVILIVSGGLDSIIIWAYLMKVYGLEVFPLFLNRGQRRAKIEEKSVDYFYKYYKKIFPKLCQPIQKMNAYIPPMEIRFPITIHSNNVFDKSGRWMGIPMYSNLLVDYAVQYAYFLQVTRKIKIRNIFSGFMKTDGTVMKDETLTAVRVNNLTIAELTDDYSWQFIALPIEKEVGFFYEKKQFIQWANKENLPIEKTRSCIMWGSYHCGECVSCFTRKKAFEKAKIKDKTIYKKSFKSLIKDKLNFIKKSKKIQKIASIFSVK